MAATIAAVVKATPKKTGAGSIIIFSDTVD
jgi:hypothetical protein